MLIMPFIKSPSSERVGRLKSERERDFNDVSGRVRIEPVWSPFHFYFQRCAPAGAADADVGSAADPADEGGGGDGVVLI